MGNCSVLKDVLRCVWSLRRGDDKKILVFNWKGYFMLKKVMITSAAMALLSANAFAGNAQDDYFPGQQPCAIPQQTVNNLQAQLAKVVLAPDQNGGLFKPNEMWSTVVDRKGVVCSIISSSSDAWPGSRQISMAKAFTANAFSNNKLSVDRDALRANAAWRFALRA